MSLEQQRRARFEAWVAGRKVVKRYGAHLRQSADGSYADYRINDRWLAWNAALDSIEIELPAQPIFGISAEESLEMDPDDYEAAEVQHILLCEMLRKCRAAIEAAGLRVKP